MKLLSDFEEKYNITQAQAGVILGVTKGNYSVFKNGKKGITQRYLINSIDSHMRLSKKEIQNIKKIRLGI